MLKIFNQISKSTSELTTKSYSTSFSFGIKALSKSIQQPIYNIYGFVRFADEIVDTFHNFNKQELLKKFKKDTFHSIESGISLNPILNSFQAVVNEYNIDHKLINLFFNSMFMDLNSSIHDDDSYKKYILGSAEVVGLMCLKVFLDGDEKKYNQLKPHAMSLGSAFQKVNFLRDINDDFVKLGRTYFPGVDMNNFTEFDKMVIEDDIIKDFENALIGIKQLPSSSKGGVYLAYIYYYKLFKKIKTVPHYEIFNKRIRVQNSNKILLMFQSVVKNQFNLI